MNRRDFLAHGVYAAAGWALVATGCGPLLSTGGASGGRVLVYAALTAENGRALKAGFEQQHAGTTIDMVTAGTGALLARIASERRAGGVRADVLLLADPTAIAGLRAEGILAGTVPSAAMRLPAAFRGTDWFAPYSFDNVIVFHRGAKVPAPADWSDLTRPTYRGLQEIANPAYSGTTLAMVGVLADKLGWSFFQALARQGVRVVQSTNTVGTDVAGGSRSVGISLDAVARPLQAEGSPLEMIWPASGTITVPAPAALVHGRDGAAANAFAAWLLSPAAQAILGKRGLTPVSGGALPASVHRLPVDWARLRADRQSVLSRFNSTFGL